MKYNYYKNGYFGAIIKIISEDSAVERIIDKMAFTLAEVLITLGIIGVVAAITIPGLMSKYYEIQTVSRLKETYSILNQAIRLASEEEGLPEEWGITGRNQASALLVAEKLIPYLKVALDCGTDITNTNCFTDTYYLLNGTVTSRSDSKNCISLLNGTSVALEGGSVSNDIYMYALIDTNGSAPPNIWGRDIFEFTYRSEVGLLPSGNPQESSNTYKNFCSNTSHTGYGCAYYVLTFGNMDYLKKKN